MRLLKLKLGAAWLLKSAGLGCLLLVPQLAWAQGGAPNAPPATPTTAQEREQQRVEAERRIQIADTQRRMENIKQMSGRTKPTAPGNAPLLRASETELTAKERKLLEPAAELRVRFAAFLAQPETGLCKLLAEKSSKTLNATSGAAATPPLPLLGAGTYYSFTKLKHDANEWADLRLRDGMFQAGITSYSLGMLTMLGDVPLEAVTTNSPGTDFLAAFSPPTDFAEAVQQYGQFKQGAQSSGFIYKAEMPVLPDQVYVLRSVSYKRADSLLVFRVVAQGTDGSVTLLWKRLQRYPVLALKGIPAEKKKLSGGPHNLITVMR